MKTNTKKTEKIEVVLAPALKQNFYAGCERRGYSPSRLVRLMMAEKLMEWETSTPNPQIDDMAEVHICQNNDKPNLHNHETVARGR